MRFGARVHADSLVTALFSQESLFLQELSLAHEDFALDSESELYDTDRDSENEFDIAKKTGSESDSKRKRDSVFLAAGGVCEALQLAAGEKVGVLPGAFVACDASVRMGTRAASRGS